VFVDTSCQPLFNTHENGHTACFKMLLGDDSVIISWKSSCSFVCAKCQ